MKTKTISEKRLPKQVKEILTAIAGKGFIAGGDARDILLGTHTASDIDIFFYEGPNRKVEIEPNDHDPDEPTIWTPSGPILDDLRDLGYEYTRQLPNAWEFIMPRKDGKHNRNYLKVQVIQPFQNQWMRTFGTPEQVIGQFDFTVVKAAVWAEYPDNTDKPGAFGVHVGDRVQVSLKSGKVEDIRKLPRFYTMEDDAFRKDNKRHRLIITHINCPIAVSMRVNKYCAKGFYIGPKEIIKLFKEWDNREQTYKDRLIELADRDNLDPKE